MGCRRVSADDVTPAVSLAFQPRLPALCAGSTHVSKAAPRLHKAKREGKKSRLPRSPSVPPRRPEDRDGARNHGNYLICRIPERYRRRGAQTNLKIFKAALKGARYQCIVDIVT